MTLPDVLREALKLVDREYVVITRDGSDHQVRLSGKGIARAEMCYVEDKKPICPWFTFEGFSADDALADDWRILCG